jgi:serine O-acetyltransferase
MLFKAFIDEIDAMMARDPAARSRLEVVLAYPGFHALVYHRLAHGLWRRRWFLLGRLVAHLGRMLTGIDIHPGARIGKRLFIDHGTGLVVGETSEIGDDVTLYQGVTLGGVSPSVDSASQINRKRHPTIGNGAIVGSGAQVLGPIVVGEGARVGANAVVVADVPAGATVVGIPARVVAPRGGNREFVAYGTPRDEASDPVARCLEELTEKIAALQARIVELEARRKEPTETEATKAPQSIAGGAEIRRRIGS